jgi:hypothetical protein
MFTALVWIAVAILVFVRQFQPHPLKSRFLVIGPAILAFFGLQGLTHLDSVEAAAFFALNTAVAVIFGIWRGYTFRVWAQNGEPWLQGTFAKLTLWVAAVAVRVVLMGVGHAAGLTSAGTVAQLALLLGITFAAQNAVIWIRTTYRPTALA